MSNNDLTPARRTAIDFVQALADAHSVDDFFRFPSIKQMASTAGVSYKTMWKAVDKLARRGVVDSHPRHGVFLHRESGRNSAAGFALS